MIGGKKKKKRQRAREVKAREEARRSGASALMRAKWCSDANKIKLKEKRNK
jgi:hypothetical protein